MFARLAFTKLIADHSKMQAQISPSLTIVCCIEAGRLERQTIRMIGSLREFGGALSKVRVLAVIGRGGPSLQSSTLDELSKLGAELFKANSDENPATWFGYANKAAAVSTAQRLAASDLIAWVDSDVLFAAPPTGLILCSDVDFAARSEFLPPAIRPDDPAHVGYWKAILGLFDLDLAEVPWVDRQDGRPAQKMFFNSGIFVWRRSSSFAGAYCAAFEILLKSRLAQRNGTFHFVDQVILTPVVLQQALRWGHLSANEHFMIFDGFIDGLDAAPPMQDAQILHYSRSLDEPFRKRFLFRLERETPHVFSYLAEIERLSISAEGQSVAVRATRLWRGLRWRIHSQRVRRCPDDGTRFAISEGVVR